MSLNTTLLKAVQQHSKTCTNHTYQHLDKHTKKISPERYTLIFLPLPVLLATILANPLEQWQYDHT